jgi:glycosyltransferase XagB
MSTLLAPSPRLGDLLLKSGIISLGRLQRCLELQEHKGGRLGDILIGENMIGYYDLYRAIAAQLNLPFVDLLKTPPTPHLLHEADISDYLRLQLVPWRSEKDVITIAICDPSNEVMEWIRTHFGNKAQLIITSPLDIRRTIECIFGNSLETSSCMKLWENAPHASARRTLSNPQVHWIGSLLLVTLLGLIHAPAWCILVAIMICQMAYFITMVFKCLVFTASSSPPMSDFWTKALEKLDTQTLPIYTVLIPMYKEAASLPSLIEVLQKLDYPPHKLDIKLVLESDDLETINAAYALKPSYQFEIIRVPRGVIRTKPKACNYALRFTRGEFITVFDADDHPDPLQLKKAVYMFRHSPPDVVCLQARLNYYNAGENVLTGLFSLEYTILFNFMLPGLERLGMPIPLGGTSNHIARERLLEEGEWDPFNVTEDADLGARFAARGLKTRMLDSITHEEAPSTVNAWIKQRSRWIKGYMQTWLVHMRSPRTLLRTLGWRGFLGFQCFVGLSTFTFLTAPFMWALSLLWVGNVFLLHEIAIPSWLVWLTIINIVFNVVGVWCFTANCLPLYRRRSYVLFLATFLYPLYMLLHSIASYKALWQLIFRPHFWEKTTHGLTKPFASRHLNLILGSQHTP